LSEENESEKFFPVAAVPGESN